MPHLRSDTPGGARTVPPKPNCTDFPLRARKWVAIGGKRRLFLPIFEGTESPTLAYCLHFFSQPIWSRWIYRIFLVTGLRGAGDFVAEVSDGNFLRHLFPVNWQGWQLLPISQTLHLAANYGSPGPYQKLSALFVNEDAQGIAFVKVGLSDQASEMVLRESAWLERLLTIQPLRGSVPKVLQTGTAGNTQAYLMTTIAPKLGTCSRFTQSHVRFLSALGGYTATLTRFADCMEARFIDDALGRLISVLGGALHWELNCARNEIRLRLKGWFGPLVLAHRDFVPWNISICDNHLFVFDWEYAADKASPLYDFFHFHLMPAAASRFKPLRTTDLRGVVFKALSFARCQYPNTIWSETIVSSWLLVYLLDVVLFYTDSNKVFNPRRPILASYVDMIRQRELWQVR